MLVTNLRLSKPGGDPQRTLLKKARLGSVPRRALVGVAGAAGGGVFGQEVDDLAGDVDS